MKDLTIVVKKPPPGVTITLTSKVKLSRGLQLRYWLALRLIKIGCRIANINLEDKVMK